MAWEENPRICLHMQLIAILSRTGVMYNINVPKAKRCILLFPYKRPLVCMGLEEAMSPRNVVTCCKSCSSCFFKSASRIVNNTNKPITPFSR